MSKKYIFLLAAALIFCAHSQAFAGSGGAAPEEGKYFEVSQVIDGDTFVLQNEKRVRVLGVDAPEVINSPKLHRDARKLGVRSSSVKTMGLESKSYLESLIQGKKVRLEYEGQKRDHNGRVLAYIYLEDGTFVNAEILRHGYGTLLEPLGNSSLRHRPLFYEMQNEAIAHERGQWLFISRRVEQLFEGTSESLSFDQRREVLDYINQMRSGRVRESYVPVSFTPKIASSAEASARTQKVSLPQTSSV